MQASLMGQDVDAPLQKLLEHEQRLTQVVEAIHHGFLGEDSYWARLEDGSDD
jgi:hypothetical protein